MKQPLMTMNGRDYLWDDWTKQVLLDEGPGWRVIGYADDARTARKVVKAWLKTEKPAE